jgi:hypothetical protein
MSISNALKTMALALGGMVVVFFVVGALLANHWHVETARVVKARPEQLLPLLTDWDSWDKWSTMKVTLGPQLTRTVEGKPGTIGHRVVWSGSEGSAAMSLTRIDAEGVSYDFRTRRAGDGTEVLAARGSLQLKAQGAETLVTWRDDGEIPDYAGRWVAWFGALQESVRQLQTSCLSGLQNAVEPELPATGSGQTGLPQQAK